MAIPVRTSRYTAIAGIGLLALGFVCFAAGLRVNTTKSIPVGLYRIVDEPVEKGAYVIFCPPKLDVFDEAKERGYIAAGFCPGDYGLMMKRVSGRRKRPDCLERSRGEHQWRAGAFKFATCDR